MIAARAGRGRAFSAAAGSWSFRFGIAITTAVLLVALVGPYLAPNSPTALVGVPFSDPSSEFVLGTDMLGRDVLSRVLAGGRDLVLLAGLATVIAWVVGGIVGLTAGYSRSALDPILMRGVDFLLAFPPLLFLLILAAGLGPGELLIVVGTSLVQIPGIARVARTATLEASVRPYVEAAVARGESAPAIVRREVLPNIIGPLAAAGGPSFTISILMIAAINFFALGVAPGTPDWGLMISENRGAISLQPWALAAPAMMIAFLTIGVNLVIDAGARSRDLITRQRLAA